jgi:hypothetical protein
MDGLRIFDLSIETNRAAEGLYALFQSPLLDQGHDNSAREGLGHA